MRQTHHRAWAPVVAVAIVAALPAIALGRPSAEEVVKTLKDRKTPVGVEAAEVFEQLQKNSFEKNVEFSNQWIKDQLAAIDKTDKDYQEYVAEMVDGPGDGALPMRRWLTDEKNVGTWDKNIQKLVGDDGYARVVAMNGAFKPGSEEFRLVYGGSRRYEPAKKAMMLNDSERAGERPEKMLVSFKSDATMDEKMATLIKFGDGVRKQMLKFYDDFKKGDVTEEQVTTFNEAYAWTGGCALGATNTLTDSLANRYLVGLHNMAETLGELGYKVQPQ